MYATWIYILFMYESINYRPIPLILQGMFHTLQNLRFATVFQAIKPNTSVRALHFTALRLQNVFLFLYFVT
jgi:hypothetical protein